MPRVSIIMPVYNCASFLGESVGSVLAQTIQDFELIAVDDGSSDTSWETIQGLKDKRVRTFRFPQNRGIAVVRRFGVKQADCQYLAFLDADDIANPARLEIQVNCLDSRADLGAVASRAWILNSGRMYQQPFVQLQPDEISATLLFRNCIVLSSVMIRRQDWRPHRAEYQVAADYELWARLTPQLRVGSLRRGLVTYRDHSGGSSKRQSGRMTEAIRKIHQEQLERIGLPSNLDLHGMLSAWPADVSSETLAEADLWLRNIVGANRIYDPPSLRRVIERLWFQICLDSWLLGPQAFHIYRRSALSRLTPVRMARFFRRFGRRALTGR